MSVGWQNNLASYKLLGIVIGRQHIRLYVFVVVLTIIFATLFSRHSAFAGNARLWRTDERINGSSSTEVSFPKISAGGHYVVFHSSIPNLVPNDSNNFCDTDGNGVADNSCADIFVYDRENVVTTLVSVSSGGTQGNLRSTSPSINRDARYITFQSQADNLVPDGAHTCLYFSVFLRQCTDIFVHDRGTGITEQVSVASDGTKANGNSNFPSISADGRYIVFSSEASNLIPSGTHICPGTIVTPPVQCTHIFVHDRQTGTTERVSVASNGERGNTGSYQSSISADGRHVVFLSTANNLVPNDNNGKADIFVRHLDTGQTVLVSIVSDGTQGNQGAEFGLPAINADGRYIAFISRSTNLVANDTNGVADVFVHDLQTGTTIRASIATDGSQANLESGTYNPSLSSDGRYILFDSSATNLVNDDTNGARDIFVRDLQTATTTRVSVAQDGSQANSDSYGGSISTDGSFASFSSAASNLIPGDLNNTPDIFVAEASSVPTVPYLSQIDPLWASLEYDHGNSTGPFFCGTTIGGCGCAITSSAMLLKYHGATKSPTGEETNPNTLNTWLKNNNGYAFGALKWNSIAAYSVKANTLFSTQKIKFAGVGPPNTFAVLDSDLSAQKPTILEEPGHFILATGKQSPTYSINDPAYINRKTLAAYSDSFKSMRRFEKTNTDLSAIYISTPAPNEILITDSQGRKAGKDSQSGQTFTEIPNSFYFLEPALVDQTSNDPVSLASSGVNMLVIINPLQDTYKLNTTGGKLDVSAYNTLGDIVTEEFATPMSENFQIDYSPQDNSLFETFQESRN